MLTTITTRGQTVVPAEIRKRFGITEQSKLEWILDGENIRVVPLPADTIDAALGLFAKGPSLSKALMRSRRDERRNEAKTLSKRK